MGPRLWRASIALATLLITLWVLPAFTRQWGDRQNARGLKAGLATEIATATADMLGPSIDVDQQDTAQPLADRSRVWLMHRLIIGAKLRAYFDEIYLAEWNVFSDYTLKFVQIAGAIDEIRVENGAKKASRSQRASINHRLDEFPMPAGDGRLIPLLLNSGELLAVTDLSTKQVLKEEEAITRRLLAAHPSGFSTSRIDLLRDIVPFWDLKEEDLPTP